jgi:predicted enzyme related to lactoylglutathione lyase
MTGGQKSTPSLVKRLGQIQQGGFMDRVVHFEIPYDNKDRASKFYSEIFG